MGEIEVRNEVRRSRVSRTALEAAARKILGVLGRPDASLSILLVSDKKIRSLNRRYLGRDHSTDVIAFGSFDVARGQAAAPFLGDIVISLSTARRQARLYGNSFSYELHFYLCHGILHLLGYRDKTKEQAREMWRKQENILGRIGVWPSKRPKRLS